MKIINYRQGSEEWLSWRRGGLGASDIPAILGLLSYKTPNDVYQEKLGNLVTIPNKFMQRGTEFEGEARKRFEEEIGDSYPALCVERSDKPYQRASLDGYNHGFKEILEIKIPSTRNFEKISRNDIPEAYRMQMFWQMYVSGTNKGYCMIYHPETKESVIVLVKYDPEIIEKNLNKIEEFWQGVLNKTPPKNCKPLPEHVEDPALHYLFRTYIGLKRDICSMEGKLKEYRDEIIAKSKNKDVQCGNFRLQKREVSRVDYKIACTDNNLDLEPYKKSTTLTWTILEKK